MVITASGSGKANLKAARFIPALCVATAVLAGCMQRGPGETPNAGDLVYAGGLFVVAAPYTFVKYGVEKTLSSGPAAIQSQAHPVTGRVIADIDLTGRGEAAWTQSGYLATSCVTGTQCKAGLTLWKEPFQSPVFEDGTGGRLITIPSGDFDSIFTVSSEGKLFKHSITEGVLAAEEVKQNGYYVVGFRKNIPTECVGSFRIQYLAGSDDVTVSCRNKNKITVSVLENSHVRPVTFTLPEGFNFVTIGPSIVATSSWFPGSRSKHVRGTQSADFYMVDRHGKSRTVTAVTDGPVERIDSSPDGRWISAMTERLPTDDDPAALKDAGNLRIADIINATTGDIRKKIVGFHNSLITSLLFSKNGRYVCAKNQNNIVLADLDKDHVEVVRTGDTYFVDRCIFNDRSDRVAVLTNFGRHATVFELPN